jgi:hypothetical protein
MKILKVATAIIGALLAFYILFVMFKAKKEERDLLSWIKLSVIEIDNSIPPGLLIEVRNNGSRVVGKIHFRLVFRADEKEFCRVDKDYGNFGPNEKREILLKAADINKGAHFSSQTRIRYILQAFPEYKKGLDVIEGEFFLE